LDQRVWAKLAIGRVSVAVGACDGADVDGSCTCDVDAMDVQGSDATTGRDDAEFNEV